MTKKKEKNEKITFVKTDIASVFVLFTSLLLVCLCGAFGYLGYKFYDLIIDDASIFKMILAGVGLFITALVILLVFIYSVINFKAGLTLTGLNKKDVSYIANKKDVIRTTRDMYFLSFLISVMIICLYHTVYKNILYFILIIALAVYCLIPSILLHLDYLKVKDIKETRNTDNLSEKEKVEPLKYNELEE